MKVEVKEKKRVNRMDDKIKYGANNVQEEQKK
jgi:hypothetical protein